MEAVFGLLEDDVGVLLEDFFGDFLFAVGGEAVEDDVVVGRSFEEGAIHLVGTEEGFLFGLSFLSHGEPDVGVDDVGSGDGGLDIGGGGDVGGGQFFKERGGREVFGGTGHRELEAEVFGGPHPRDGHVRKAVADEGDLLSFPGAEALADGEEVSEDLAGMFVVGEGVDGGDFPVVGELDDVVLGKGPDDGSVHHATEDAGGVLDGLAAAQLDVVTGKKHGGASEFADSDFEGDAGAGGGFGENEGPGLSRERLELVVATARLHLDGAVDQHIEFLGREFFDGQEMIHEEKKGSGEHGRVGGKKQVFATKDFSSLGRLGRVGRGHALCSFADGSSSSRSCLFGVVGMGAGARGGRAVFAEV